MKIIGKFMENLFSVAIKGDYLEISFNYSSNNKFSSKVRYLQKLRDFLFDWKIKIDGNLVYDAHLYPNNFHVELNSVIIHNQDLDQIYDINFGTVKVVSIITPNIYKIGEGKHKITLKYQKNKFTFYTSILCFDDEIKFPAQSQVEIIKQHIKPPALKEEEIKRYFSNLRKIVFLVVILLYLGVGLYFFSLLLPALLDPLASQFDSQLCYDGAGGAIITWGDYRSVDEYHIYAQHINYDPTTPENGVVPFEMLIIVFSFIGIVMVIGIAMTLIIKKRRKIE